LQIFVKNAYLINEVRKMLNAYSSNKNIVTLLDMSPKAIEALKKDKYFCPACNQQVYIKNGRIKLPHFAHFVKSSCSFYAEPETQEHLALKQVFAKWCEQQQLPYEVEKFLPALNQRPDLLIGNLAVEIQCSPLSIQRLIERTKCYQKHGYRPLWICGKKLSITHNKLSELTKNLSYYSEKLGFYLWTADLEKKELVLFYHLEEDWSKKLYAAKKIWRFYQKDLFAIFNYPLQAKLYLQRKHKSGRLIKAYYVELEKRLVRRDERVRSVQSILYSKQLHILNLPYWFYAPGLHIFCCRHSDLLLKYRIWAVVRFFDQKIICNGEFLAALRSEVQQAQELFCPLPNITAEQLQDYCLYYLLKSLIACGHLKMRSREWVVTMPSDTKLLDQMERFINKCAISATPIKNMI
jgi:competence protein CoiA